MRLDSDDDADNRKHANKENKKHPFDESMNEDQKENYNARTVISLGQLPPLPPAVNESESFDNDADYDEKSDGQIGRASCRERVF